MKGCNIFFVKIAELIYFFCVLTGTYYHQSASQRIECSGMANLNLFYPKSAPDHYPDLIHKIERCPVKWFIKQQNLPFFKNAFCLFFHSNLRKLKVSQL